MKPTVQSPRVRRVSVSSLTRFLGLAILIVLMVAPAVAQTAHATYGVSVIGSGFGFTPPTANGYPGPGSPVAVDGLGNVFVEDRNGHKILRFAPATVGYTKSTVMDTTPYVHTAMTVDNANALYVVVSTQDFANGVVFKFTPAAGGGYTSTQTPLDIFGFQAVAVDASGALYGREANTDAVYKLTPSGGGYSKSQIFGASDDETTNLLTDRAGNGSVIYEIEFKKASPIAKYTLIQGVYQQQLIQLAGTQEPDGVIADQAGALYAAAYTPVQDSHYDGLSGNQNDFHILKETPVNGSYAESVFLPHLQSTGVPFGMAIDANGNFFHSSANRLFRYTPTSTATEFGQVDVRKRFLLSVTFQFDTGGQLAATPFHVTTEGVENLDFVSATDPADLDSSECVVGNTYAAGSTCTVRVIFQPRQLGLRKGAVALVGAGGNTIATATLSGIGTGPHAVYDHPATSNAVSDGYLLGADGVGSFFVYRNGVTYKEAAGAGGFAETAVTSNASPALSVATDNYGAVFITDAGGQRILKEAPDGAGGYTESVIDPNVQYGIRLVSDANGGFYLLNLVGPYYAYTWVVSHYVPQGTTYTPTTVYTSTTHLDDMTVDSKGLVYLTDYVNNKVLLLSNTGAGYVISSSLDVTEPYRLSTDGADAVDVLTGSTVTRLQPMPDGSYQQSVLYSRTPDPYNPFQRFAINPANDLFLQDTTAPVQLAALSTPGSFSFAATSVGSTSTDSPMVTKLTNIGTYNLALLLPPTGLNPSVSANFSLIDGVNPCPVVSNLSAQPGFVAPGSQCGLGVNFTPTAAGTISGSVSVLDNDLFNPAAIQTLGLTGVGSDALNHFAITGVPANAVAGTSFNVTVTAYADAGNTVAATYTRPVHFTSTDAQAVLPTDIALTNGVGQFAVTLRTVGGQQITVADTTGSPSATTPAIVTTNATASAIQMVSGSGQTTFIGQPFGSPLVAQVSDAYGNPVQGVQVTFTVPPSGPSATLSTPLATDAKGQTSVSATANGLSATQQYYAVASIAGGATANFLLVNVPAQTSVSLSSNPVSIPYGSTAPVTLTAALNPVYISGTAPGGSVYFFEGAGPNYTYLPNTPHAAVANALASYTIPNTSTLAPGSHPYNVYYTGDNNFQYATAATTLIVSPANVTLSGFAQNPVVYGSGGSVTFDAFGQSNGPGIAVPSGTVQYTLRNASNASVASGTVTLVANGIVNSLGSVPISPTLAVGSYTLQLAYGGDTNYSTATNTLGVQVTQATVTVTINSPMPGLSRIYGPALGITASAVANSATVPGVFGYTATLAGGSATSVSALTVLRPGVYTLQATFTPTDTTAYAPASASTTLTITKATPTLAWSNPANITDNTPLSSTQLNATVGGITGGDVVGTFVYSPPAGTKLSAGPNQVLGVTFNPTSDDAQLYTSASTTAHINVIALTPQTITFGQPESRTFGDTPFSIGPTSTSGLAVTTVVQSGPASISNNVVTITGAGTIVLVASQPGDSQYAAATSVTRAVVVNGAPTTTQVNLVSGQAAPSVNTPFSLSIHVRNPNLTPLGTVTVSEGNVTLGTGTFANGDVVVPVTLSSGGSHTLTTTYVPSSANYLASSGAITVDLGKAPQTITFAAPPNKTYGDAPFSLNATSTSGLPVTFTAFTNNITIAGNVVTLVGGGTATIAADQAGDNATNAATQVVRSFTIAPLATTTTATVFTANPAVNELVGVSYTVAANGAVPVGIVTLSEAGSKLVDGPLNNGSGLAYVKFATGGTHTVTVTYAPTNTGFSPSSGTAAAVLPKIAQTITFTLPAATKNYGDAPFVLSATSSSGLPVTLSVTSGQATIGNGVVTLTGVGDVIVTATQAGDDTYAAAPSVARQITVNAAPTTTNLTQVTASPAIGTNVSFQVAVASAAGLTPPGSVVLSEAGVTLGTATLANGQGSVSASFATAGVHALTATYTTNDNRYATSTGTLNVTIGKSSQTIAFNLPGGVHTYGDGPIALNGTATSSLPITYNLTGAGSISGTTLTITGAGSLGVTASQPGNANYNAATPVSDTIVVAKAASAVSIVSATANANQGAPVVFTITVSGPGVLRPGGSVTLTEGPTTLGAAPLTNGATQVSVAAGFSAGAQVITAFYSGDGNYAVSNATIAQTVSAPAFTLIATPDPLVVRRGNSATANLTLTPVGGYHGTLSLTCGSLPAGVTCAFAPSSFVAAGDNAVLTGKLTVTAGLNLGQVQTQHNGLMLATLLPGAGLLLLFLRRKQAPRLLVLALLTFATAAAITGCGTSSNGLSAPGTYPVTLTVGDGTSTNVLKLSIVIQD